MAVKLLTEHHSEIQSLKGGCTGSSEPTLVKIEHCWKSHLYYPWDIERAFKASYIRTCTKIMRMLFYFRVIMSKRKTSPPKPSSRENNHQKSLSFWFICFATTGQPFPNIDIAQLTSTITEKVTNSVMENICQSRVLQLNSSYTDSGQTDVEPQPGPSIQYTSVSGHSGPHNISVTSAISSGNGVRWICFPYNSIRRSSISEKKEKIWAEEYVVFVDNSCNDYVVF